MCWGDRNLPLGLPTTIQTGRFVNDDSGTMNHYYVTVETQIDSVIFDVVPGSRDLRLTAQLKSADRDVFLITGPPV